MRFAASDFVRWNPTGETALAVAAACAVVGLSLAMRLAGDNLWLQVVLRDVCQVAVVGLALPILRIARGDDWRGVGLTLAGWKWFVSVDLVLGGLLVLLFMGGSPPPASFAMTGETWWVAAYVMLTLCFEVVFFYAYLRTALERAFGVVPALLLTAGIYALHHIGFQPEYAKLTFVGLLYALVYRLGDSALVIFPFFIGVGGVYDVLIQSEAVAPIVWPAPRAVFLAAVIAVLGFWLFRRSRGSRAAGADLR